MERVTAVVCTRNRYDTTLSPCLIALGLQTYPVDGIWVYDDSDKHIDLRDREPYKQIFLLLAQKKIGWQVTYGNGLGQVRGHKLALRECKTKYLWRVDDDCIPEAECLEKLMLVMESDSNCGACGGLVLDASHQAVSKMASNKIEDIYLGLNVQWYRHSKDDRRPYDVDHLYSTFVFKRGEDYYPSNLSRIGHREETIATYRMKRAGMSIKVQPEAITWHLKASAGGIRDGYAEMWQQDEAVFSELMRDWGIKASSYKVIVLDNGLGDHYAFKTILPEVMARYSNLILACCYPDVFRDFKVGIMSIAEAQAGSNRETGVYRWMAEHNHTGSLIDAYTALYLS